MNRRQPFPREALGFCDLTEIHFARNLRTPAFRQLAATRRCKIEPFVSHDVVDIHALARGVSEAEVVKRVSASLPCGYFKLGQ